MPLPLPNLDTRRWADLVDDARGVIARYAPAWTDYNAHDPGITLVELFAWLVEMDVYRVNCIPPRHILKFLELLGFPPKPPEPAHVPLTFTGAGTIPVGAQFSTGSGIAFRTLRDMTIGAAAFAALQVDIGDGIIHDQTSQLGANAAVPLFGALPVAGSAAYLGFSSLPAGAPLTFYFWFTAPGGGIATLVWEAYTGGPDPWTIVAVTADHTRSLTENGEIQLSVPAGLVAATLGENPAPLYYLRCRVASASYDAAPTLMRVAPNTMVAEQAIPASETYSIAPTATISGPAPSAGQQISFDCAMDDAGIIQSLTFLAPGAGGAPLAGVVSYQPPAAPAPGMLMLDMAHAGESLLLPAAPMVRSTLHLFTLQSGAWQEWTRVADLDSSTRTDFHFAIDPVSGSVTFGDGERGRALPDGALVFAQYLVTLAGNGNVAPGEVTSSPLSGITVANFGASWGGAAQEDLESATGRAAALLYNHDPLAPHPPTNGVNLQDFERMALSVPHTRVARVKAYANLDGRYPCLTAPGSVTVVVIPDLHVPAPMPSAHLLAAVESYLCRRRIVCTQVHVIAPTYVTVRVSAQVAITADASAPTVKAAIIAALNAFLDPLTGGPDGTGWPFGRDVYRTEIMALITAVGGVDYVTSLAISANGGSPNCGNLSICAAALTSPGAHQILITTEAA
jgi:hypothetical protein